MVSFSSFAQDFNIDTKDHGLENVSYGYFG